MVKRWSNDSGQKAVERQGSNGGQKLPMPRPPNMVKVAQVVKVIELVKTAEMPVPTPPFGHSQIAIVDRSNLQLSGQNKATSGQMRSNAGERPLASTTGTCSRGQIAVKTRSSKDEIAVKSRQAEMESGQIVVK